MSFLLDTDSCSAHLKRPSRLAHRFVQHLGRLSVPTMVLAELHDWAHLRPDPCPRLNQIDELISDLDLLSFDSSCAAEFGQFRSLLRRKGVGVASLDLMIATVPEDHDLTLVTHNTGHFTSIPELRIVDWIG